MCPPVRIIWPAGVWRRVRDYGRSVELPLPRQIIPGAAFARNGPGTKLVLFTALDGSQVRINSARRPRAERVGRP